MHIGHSIQYALWKNEETINWLADQMCVTRATISAWANSPKKGLPHIDGLSAVFGVSEVEFLLYAKEYDPGTMAANRRWFDRYKD